jgi:hypothetical protein
MTPSILRSSEVSSSYKEGVLTFQHHPRPQHLKISPREPTNILKTCQPVYQSGNAKSTSLFATTATSCNLPSRQPRACLWSGSLAAEFDEWPDPYGQRSWLLHSLVSAVGELDPEDLIRFLRALWIELPGTSGTHDEIGIRLAEIVKTYG